MCWGGELYTQQSAIVGIAIMYIAIVCIAIMYIAIVCTAIMYIAISYIAKIMHIAIRYVDTLYVACSYNIQTHVFGYVLKCFGGMFWDVFWMLWGCFLDVLGMFSGCFGNGFWRHFTNQATPSNPSVPGGDCKFADAGTKNKCPYEPNDVVC